MILSKNPFAAVKWKERFRPLITVGLILSSLLAGVNAQTGGLGDKVIEFLESHDVERGATWNVWEESYAEPDWIVQHPDPSYLGQSEQFLPVAETCNSTSDCDLDYHLQTCTTSKDCARKQFCPVGDYGPVWDCPDDVSKTHYFARASCEMLDSTQKGVGMPKEKLCVGHSYTLYERMYNHIIQAEHFVDITSLISFDQIAAGGVGMEFAAAMRNAITYLASTGKTITIRLHFGYASTNVHDLADELTRDWDLHEATNNIDLHVTTYQVADVNITGAFEGDTLATGASWNHGKILAVDGDKLFTGGTNPSTKSYLFEDPVFDVNLQVQGKATETAHEYANMLHRGGCGYALHVIIEDWSANIGHAGYAWRTRDGVRPQYDPDSDMGPHCPPMYVPRLHRRATNTSGTPFRIIPAARLGLLPEKLDESHQGIRYGSKTSDLAMYAMITNAVSSVKISQQDLLPFYFVGTAYTRALANDGYAVGSWIDQTTGLAKFDDTWRKIEAVATALSKEVTVSIIVSAACAVGGSPEAYGPETLMGGRSPCNEHALAGTGYDYWARVYDHNNASWPEKRPIDKEPLFLPPVGNGATANFVKIEEATSQQRKLLQDIYGSGWSLDNLADWLYAYLAIFPEKRPTNTYGSPVSDGEVVNLICKFAEIGHMRMTAEEDTYVRVDDDGNRHRGGQVGNHAKVVMADDSIFYVGSDNMYGAGLAEFGIVVDDKAKGADFEEEYFAPYWEQVLGTIENPGLVTGQSRLSAGCPWKERLPVRNKPWMDIELIVAYGDRIYFQSIEENNWLGYSEGSIKALDARSRLGTFDGALEAFRWTIRSDLNGGVDLPIDPSEDIVRQTPDPMAGSCVKYGDIVYLQNNVQNNLWLSGGNGDVQANDHTHFGDKTPYQWIVRSVPGSGLRTDVDPDVGSCMSDGADIYLQSNTTDGMWLSKSTGNDGVSTEDTSGGNSYIWRADFSPTNLGERCGSDENCDSGYCTTENICSPKVPFGERCSRNDDCISGRCESWGPSINQIYKTCQAKAAKGSACNEDSDCMSGICKSICVSWEENCLHTNEGCGIQCDRCCSHEWYWRWGYPSCR